MKITGFEITTVQVSLKKPFTHFYATVSSSDHILLRMHTDEGLIGIAETSCPQPPEILHRILTEYLCPAVIGMDPREFDRLHEVMEGRLRGIRAGNASTGAYTPCRYAIDEAAYDVAGKASGMPVCSLLGGKYRDAIPVCDVIGLEEPSAVKLAARSLLDRGFRQVKLKAGHDFTRDIATVRAVKEACGDELQVRLDINTGYKNAAIALPRCLRLEEAGVDIFEQPVEPQDLEGMALLCDRLTVPVLIHEGLATIDDALRIIQMKAADILNLSPNRAGGLYPAIQIVRLAELHNMPIMIAGSMEAGCANLASAHVGAACHEQPYPSDARGVLRESETLIKEPIKLEAGFIHLIDGPGLGVTFDDAAIERCQTTPWQRVGFKN